MKEEVNFILPKDSTLEEARSYLFFSHHHPAIMPPKTNKIYKLKPTDGPLSRDDLSTWIFTVQSYARQCGWAKFLSDGENKTWTATAEDPTNGLQVLWLDGSGVDNNATSTLRNSFRDFLAAVAANCPTLRHLALPPLHDNQAQ